MEETTSIATRQAAAEMGPSAPDKHACIVPRAFAKYIVASVEIGGKLVGPAELLAWECEAVPSEEEKDAAVRVILNRLRAGRKNIAAELFRFAQVLADAGLLSSEEQRDGRLLRGHAGSDGCFRFEEVRKVLKKPVVAGMRFLARLEAAGWLVDAADGSEPEADEGATKQRRKRPVGIRARLMSADPVSEDMLGRVRSLAWLGSVTPNDLRLWHRDEDAPQRAAQGGLQDGPTAEMVRAIARADMNTFAQEVEDVALCLAAARHGGKLVERSDRWVRIFVERYVSTTGAGKTLEEVGQLFGLTRERVRQICAKLLEARDGMDVCLPATMRTLASARRAAPKPAQEMNEQLARLLGEGAGIEAAMNFAAEMGAQQVPVVRRESRLRVGDSYEWASTIEAADETPWGTLAFTAARREISLMGCTNLLHVAGALALEHEIAPGKEALVAVMQNAPGFRWLDREGGWFTLGDGGESSGAAWRIRKVMAVARNPVNVDDIATALITDDLWLYRERERGPSVPPLHVQRELLYGWGWLKSLQKNRFTPVAPIKNDVLSEIEKMFVDIIEANGGVAARHQLVLPICEKLKITDMAVNGQIGASPVIVKIEHGLYGLIGRTLEEGALEKGRTRLRERMGVAVAPGMAGEWAKGFRVRVTEASMKHEQYPVPERFKQALRPGAVRVEGSDSELWVGPSYVLRRLKDAVPGVQPGHTCWIEVKGPGLVALRLELQPAAGVAGLLDPEMESVEGSCDVEEKGG